MKRIIALLLTILFLSSCMALAQEGEVEVTDQEIADSPVSEDIADDDPVEDIFNVLAVLNSAETKTNPYGFLFVSADSDFAVWMKMIVDDYMIVITYAFADDGSIYNESMSAANQTSDILLQRDYTNPDAVAASLTYSGRMGLTLIVPNLTDEQVSQYALAFLENLTDEYFLEIISAAEEIKMDTYSFKFPVQKGNKGDAVKFIQQKLIELGCLAGKADGDFGNKTKAAIEKFQEDNSMDVTGALDFYGFIKLISG